MKNFNKKNEVWSRVRVFCAFIAITGGGLLSGAALATTAANTVLTNTVTVDYTDAAANPFSATDSVSITVNLVESTPTLILNAGPTPNPVLEGEDSVFTYDLYVTANGPDTYDFSQTATPTNVGAATVVNSLGADELLGGSSLAADVAAAALTIDVPYDGTDDSSANGLAAGDEFVINGDTANVYLILSVDETTNGPTNNFVTITLDGTPIAAGGYSYKDQIGEYVQYTVTVTAGTISGVGPQYSVTNCAQDDAAADVQVCDGPTVVTVVEINLAVTKYVQNGTLAQVPAGPPASITVNGVTYYESGITGNPGDTMSYLIHLDNSTGSADAENVIITDPVPRFTSFATGTMSIDNDIDGTFETAASDATDGDHGEYDATVGAEELCIYPDSSGNTDGSDNADGLYCTSGGGTISAGAEVYIIYDLTIDNL